MVTLRTFTEGPTRRALVGVHKWSQWVSRITVGLVSAPSSRGPAVRCYVDTVRVVDTVVEERSVLLLGVALNGDLDTIEGDNVLTTVTNLPPLRRY